MKLLLTGATGFVGRNFLLRALDLYETIYLPVRNLEKLKSQLKLERKQFPKNLEPIVCESPGWCLPNIDVDHVVHSAGVVFARDKESYFKNHVEGTLNFLDKVPSRARVVILSSQSASGPCDPGVLAKDETGKDSPVTWYGQSKLEMENAIIKKYLDRDIVCLRPPMILGPRDQMTLPLFKMAKSPLRVKPGFKSKFYSFIAVEDLIDAIFTIFERPSQKGVRKYFVASPKIITDRDLIRVASEISKRKGMLVPVPQSLIKMASCIIDKVPAWQTAIPSLTVDRAKEIWPDRFVILSQKFNDDFNWAAKLSLEQTLQSTHEWYRRSGQI